MFAFSLSVLFQFLVVISISCAADHGNYRKRLLLMFAWTGAIATMLFLPVVPSVYLLGALLAIIANTCLGASFVLLNSFLPLLVRHHPEAQEETFDSGPEPEEDGNSVEGPLSLANSTTGLLSPAPVLFPATSTALKLSTRISSTGIGISYAASLFVQLVSIIILLLLQSSTFSLRLVLFIIGLWWFVFTIPAALWLRPRPGPHLPAHLKTSWATYITHSWTSLYRTIRLTPYLPDILLFLSAWFLLSDAIATVSGVSILFAKTTLRMSPAALALISVLVTAAGILGAFTWPYISRLLNLSPLHTILTCIFLFSLIPLYGLLDYIPFLSTLTSPWEMYPLGFLYGFVLGGLSSYCRSLYGELIPPGYEASFYALYAITDKGSSIFGPAIVGVIVDYTGSIRPAFWFLIALVTAPGAVIWWVDVDRGREAADRIGALIEREEGLVTATAHDGEEAAGLLADDADAGVSPRR
jgi:UMF1 family MFS transporter